MKKIKVLHHYAVEYIIKNGSSRDLQRYLCRSCGKTFCALTGTPLVGLYKRDKWLGQAEALETGLALNEIAKNCRLP